LVTLSLDPLQKTQTGVLEKADGSPYSATKKADIPYIMQK
jgi:hypothetical protein